ncbi:type II secretion system GspH family protein [Patescibacteria group bacterium]|nr:type II secretion system GspH family protein [Patescibacteria group bacterium]
MKKILPNSENTSKGFTLIELLVVIAIIAVLAVMGMAVFSGLTGRGNDDRRRADLKAISDALEVKRGNATAYQTITANDFAGGVIPKEPTTRNVKYCYSEGGTVIGNPTAADAGWTTGPGYCPTGFSNIDAATSIAGGTAAYYRVCTLDQGTPVAVICFGSKQ